MLSEASDGVIAVDRVRYSVVVPVYGNEATLPALIERLKVMADGLDARMEAVFVVDGSPDGSLLVLRKLLPMSGLLAQLVCHSRNFVAAMAADLQEPPELVEQFFEHLASGEYDVAVGVRTGRDDPLTTTMLSKAFWSMYRRWVHPDIPPGGVDIFACTQEVAVRLVALDESHTSMVGLLYWLGFRRIGIPYCRAPRTEGKSGWSFKRKMRYFLDSIFSFTDVPITVLTSIGVIGGALTLIASVVVIVARLTGAIKASGYTPIMLVMLLSTFTILFGLGVVGSYVWRSYENSKGRPGSVPMSHEDFDAAHDD
jgi:glycosyltransferase involved in cell wall biosynthesis